MLNLFVQLTIFIGSVFVVYLNRGSKNLNVSFRSGYFLCLAVVTGFYLLVAILKYLTYNYYK